MQYDNTNKGSLWPNTKRNTEKHPHFTGSLNVDGIEYWVSAWKKGKEDNPKAPSLRFSITKKDKEDGNIQTNKLDDELDDEIPF